MPSCERRAQFLDSQRPLSGPQNCLRIIDIHQAVSTLLVFYGAHSIYHRPQLHFTLELLLTFGLSQKTSRPLLHERGTQLRIAAFPAQSREPFRKVVRGSEGTRFRNQAPPHRIHPCDSCTHSVRRPVVLNKISSCKARVDSLVLLTISS